MKESVNGKISSGSVPSTAGPLIMDPRAIISSSCLKYYIPLARYMGSFAATEAIKSSLNP